jgi:ATP-binding cassette subfamily B protein
LGSIRDILLDGTQDLYKSIYETSDKSLRKAQGDSFFVGMSPRFAIEALGMILIALTFIIEEKFF